MSPSRETGRSSADTETLKKKVIKLKERSLRVGTFFSAVKVSVEAYKGRAFSVVTIV